MKNKFIVCIVGLGILFSCETKKSASTEEKKSEEKVFVKAPEFNSDSSYQYLVNQVEFGPRVPNTMPHRQTADYLIRSLKNFGAGVVEQDFEENSFDGTKLYLKNIVGSFNPEKIKRILLAAHWDTRPFADRDSERLDVPIDGASDGASGVAVLLEIARVISQNPPANAGVDIIFFDGEDYGIPENYTGEIIDEYRSKWSSYCLGSTYWARNKHKKGYSAYYGILVDMVGAKNARFYKEGNSERYAPMIVKKVWDTASRNGYGEFFPYKSTGAIQDDHVPVNELGKINMIDIIQSDPSTTHNFGAYHHTHADNLEVIDSRTLKAVGQTLLEVIYNE